MSEWIVRNPGKTNNPTAEGHYRVMVSGDSESIDGHVIYSFEAYEAWAFFVPDEDGGYFKGDHDEEDFTIFAYFGPIDFPNYKGPTNV